MPTARQPASLASWPTTPPTAPEAAETTMVSPAFGSMMRLSPYHAVTPGMPSFIFTRPGLKNFAEKTVRWPGHFDAIDALKSCGMLDLDPVTVGGDPAPAPMATTIGPAFGFGVAIGMNGEGGCCTVKSGLPEGS